MVFTNGNTLVVYARGPGRLHLLSYQSNAHIPNHVGAIQTTTQDSAKITKFVISHSYTFERFAFFFEGPGEAVYSIGSSLQRQPVGKSWTQASVASWGSATITTADVSGQVPGAALRDEAITAFIVPDN
ncbi:hypothetical protein VNI00_009594 [Paramarasmius palmivorus]|uniref:Uncharacterized protein n=1 Tax=Paramarasmius palmivorus TaxID=297713 RepID=A0AAW0CQC9_9AGAR